jgi:hypothetical protein
MEMGEICIGCELGIEGGDGISSSVTLVLV